MSRPTACLGALTLALAACGPGPAPPPDVLTAVDAGFAGAVHEAVPSPVWVELTNPGQRALAVRVVARGGEAARAERALELPPAARQRIPLTVRIEDRLQVEVLVGEERLGAREVKELARLEPERHVLVVDGRPADERRGTRGEAGAGDPTLRLTAIAPRTAPVEAIAYAPFGAVLVRGVAPAAWGRERRAALLEYVAHGGTLLLPGASPRNPDDLELAASLPGSWTPIMALGLRARSLRFGRGEVLAFDDELLAAAAAGPKSAQLRQDLGDLAEARRGRARVAPLLETSWLDADRPGVFGLVAVGAFVVLYLVVVGPALGLGLRKATRPRLAATLAAILLGSTVAAGAVALGVQASQPGVLVTELIRVEPDGTAVSRGNLLAASGGGRTCAVRVGAELSALGPAAEVAVPLAVTMLPIGSERTSHWDGSLVVESLPHATRARTRRGGGPLTFALPTWRSQSATTVVAATGAAPLRSVLHRDGGELRVTVVNTTGAPIERAVLLEVPEENPGLAWAAYSVVGALAPGERVTLPVARGTLRTSDPSTRLWADVLGVPRGWTSWRRGLLDPDDPRPLRLFVLSRTRGALRVEGEGVDLRHHALRADPVGVDGAQAPGQRGGR